MTAIIECHANVSEGRDLALLADLATVVEASGARMIDRQSDTEQHRAILRFAGSPAAVHRAAVALVDLAARRIDMRRHTGSHPRIGAVDLLPLVPVAGVSLAEVVDHARLLAQELAESLSIPVYLSGEAALRPERRDVAVLRAGEYEGLTAAIGRDEARTPDFGPTALGPAGACIVSARAPRLHLLLEISGLDQGDTQALSSALDEGTGALQGLECRVHNDDPDRTQLALTLTCPERLPLHRALDWTRQEAEDRGAQVTDVRLLGWVPRSVLDSAALQRLHLAAPPRTIEDALGAVTREQEDPAAPLGDFLDRLSSAEATPGGGSVAALAGALCAALAAMVAGLTVGRERFAAEESRMVAVKGRADNLCRRLQALVQADAEAFSAVMAAYQRPKEGAHEAAQRRDAIQAALRQATQVPLDTLDAVCEALTAALEAAGHGNPSAASDAGVAGYLGLAAARAAALNVEINVLGLRDLDEGDRLRRQGAAGVRAAEQTSDEIERRVRARITGGP